MLVTEKHIRILEQAEVLFAEKGYDGTTVRDIADKAGVNLAMISYYFGSKERLLEALFKYRMDLVKERLEFIIKNSSFGLAQKINTLIDEYITRAMQRQSFYKIMLLEQVTNRNVEVLRLLKDYKFSYAKLISELINQGRKAKLIKQDVDVLMLLTTMTATVTQMLINKNYYREFNDYKKMSPQAFDVLLKDQLSNHIKNIFKATLGYDQ